METHASVATPTGSMENFHILRATSLATEMEITPAGVGTLILFTAPKVQLCHDMSPFLTIIVGVLPENILPSVTYAGSPRLIIPTVRTSLDPGEALR